MKKHFILILISILSLSILLTGCAEHYPADGQNSYTQITGTVTSNNEFNNPSSTEGYTAVINAESMDLDASNKDQDPSFNENTSTKIIFTENSATVEGTGASADGKVVTVTTAGTYIFSGSCSDGQIYINATKDDKIQIVLNNLTLSSKSSTPFIVAVADKVFITLAEGSMNSISDASSYTLTIDETNIDAALFSKEDLTINGTGTLTINGNYKHGIVSKDDLVITGGVIYVNAENVGIEGKDCVKITDGTITIKSGTDGIRATNAEDSTRGFTTISGGSVTIDAGTDGIQAVTLLNITGGEIDITSGGGNTKASSVSGSGFGQWGTSSASSTSAKALKSTQDISISGGTINIDSSDDSIHSNDCVLISGGSITALSGDDGIHADLTLEINGGDIKINKSYEGLEAQNITINDGTIYVVASDDGINAAGGNDSSAMGQRPGMNNFNSTGTAKITINGGYTVVNASGDGVDANGNIVITGGITLVSGPTNNGNGSFDYDGTATISGGIFIAAGSSGMAQSFTSSSTQGSIMTNISTQSANTPITLCDSSGNVIVSFTPMKQYQNVVISVPEIKSGEKFSICTGTVNNVDIYGFSYKSTISSAKVLVSISMTSLHYGTGGSMGRR